MNDWNDFYFLIKLIAAATYQSPIYWIHWVAFGIYASEPKRCGYVQRLVTAVTSNQPFSLKFCQSLGNPESFIYIETHL